MIALPDSRFATDPPAKADAESRFDAKPVFPAIAAVSAPVATAAYVAPATSPVVTASTREGAAAGITD